MWASALKHIREALLDAQPVGFLNLGALEPYVRQGRTRTHPQSGETLQDPPKLWVRFNPSRKFRDELRETTLEEN